MFAPPRRLVIALAVVAYPLGAGVCMAEVAGEVKWDVTTDLNGDGVLDRASIVEAPDGETSDLHVFLGSKSAKAGDDAKPDIIKRAIIQGTVLAFESREKATLTLTNCTGCRSMWALEETLTVVYRDGTLVIGGFTRVWELSTRLADLNVEVTMGSCSIDFLTGEGRVSEGLDDETKVRERFRPIALADWSDETRPQICKYKGEQ
jgi:hypothetical protein